MYELISHSRIVIKRSMLPFRKNEWISNWIHAKKFPSVFQNMSTLWPRWLFSTLSFCVVRSDVRRHTWERLNVLFDGHKEHVQRSASRVISSSVVGEWCQVQEKTIKLSFHEINLIFQPLYSSTSKISVVSAKWWVIKFL